MKLGCFFLFCGFIVCWAIYYLYANKVSWFWKTSGFSCLLSWFGLGIFLTYFKHLSLRLLGCPSSGLLKNVRLFLFIKDLFCFHFLWIVFTWNKFHHRDKKHNKKVISLDEIIYRNGTSLTPFVSTLLSFQNVPSFYINNPYYIVSRLIELKGGKQDILSHVFN